MNIDSRTNETSELDELRGILLDELENKVEIHQDEIRALEEKIEKLNGTEFLAENLPEALRKSAHEGSGLKYALTPVIEESVTLSISKNKNKMAQAIVPIIGPAIRKTIIDTMRSLMQSIQLVIDHSFSIKGVLWRFESLRTGVPIAEVVLKNSLEYRVEHIFLISKKKGSVIRSVSAPAAIDIDKNTFSGMVEALKDFAEDVFVEEGEFGAMTLGKQKIIVSEGQYAILAAIVRGVPPEDLSSKINKINTEIHGRYTQELSLFPEKQNSLISCDSILEKGLLEQRYKKSKFEKFWEKIKYVITIGVIVILSFWGGKHIWNQYENTRLFNSYIKKVESFPGVLITKQNINSSNLFLSILANDVYNTKNKLETLRKEIGIRKSQLHQKIFFSKFISSTEVDEKDKAFNRILKKLEDVKLNSKEIDKVNSFKNKVSSLVMNLYRVSKELDESFIVYIMYGKGEFKLAKNVVWSLYSLVQEKYPVDYHLFRPKKEDFDQNSILSVRIIKQED